MNSLTEYGSYRQSADHDRVSLIEIGTTILRGWRLIITVPVILAIAAGTWSLTRDRAYSASASFVQQPGEGRDVGGAGAIAEQFGLRLNTDRGRSPEFYVELLRSISVLRQAVETEYELQKVDGERWKGTLIEYWELDETTGVLPPWHQAADALNGAISTSVSRETGVLTLTVTSGSPSLAEQIAARLMELLNDFNLQVRQSRAHEESRFISGLLADARAELLAAEKALQDFLRQHRGFRNSPEMLFEHDRLQRHVTMRHEVYASLLRSHEQAQIDAVRNLPLFTVIDSPAGSAEPRGRGTVLRTMLAFLVGLLIAVFIAFMAEFVRRSEEASDPLYQEFVRAARETRGDLLRPSRWFRLRRP